MHSNHDEWEPEGITKAALVILVALLFALISIVTLPVMATVLAILLPWLKKKAKEDAEREQLDNSSGD